MKVLMFVSNPFTYDPRVNNEAKSLVNAGYEVTVIAWDKQSQHLLRQDYDGIDVFRIRNTWFMKLLLKDFFRLPVWRREAYKKALGIYQQANFDVIHCHDLDTLPIGVRLKKKFGMPLIYDAHEIYGYMMTRVLPRPIANMFLLAEKRLLKSVDHIINVCEAQKDYFTGITDKPISIIMNCKPLQNLEYEPPVNKGAFTLLYIGTLSRPRTLLELVDVVEELHDVRCVIGGMGVPSYERALKDKCSRVSNVDFIGVVPFDDVIPMTREADAIFMMVDPKDLNNRMGLGNKQFEAMVCGRPIICTRGTYSGELTEQEDVGLTVEYDKETIKGAIIKLRDDPQLRERLGRNALNAAITRYNWQRQEEKLLKVYGIVKSD
jgi:glycosyltransferase involved in cell wall biosynthesis